MADDPKTLVSTDWLAAHMKDPDLRILDASWYLPAAARDPKAEYEAGHIPGARFFDIDEISDHRSDLPHMAPPAEKFMSRLRAMGIGDGHQVVVYDGAGIASAPRVPSVPDPERTTATARSPALWASDSKNPSIGKFGTCRAVRI